MINFARIPSSRRPSTFCNKTVPCFPAIFAVSRSTAVGPAPGADPNGDLPLAAGPPVPLPGLPHKVDPVFFLSSFALLEIEASFRVN